MTLDSHAIQEENIGAYLLGALASAEAERFERHAEQCPVCRDELERLRPAVEALPRSVAPLRARPELKLTIMAEVESDLAALGDHAPARPGLGERLRGRLTSLAGGLSGLSPRVGFAAVATVLIVGVIAGYGVSAIGRAGGSGEAQQGRTVAAKVDRARMPSASASLAMPSGLRDGALLRVHGMETLSGAQIYEVWIKRGDEVVGQSLFDVGENGEGVAAVADDLKDADAVMVTREPVGGSKAPSEKPVLTVPL